MTMNKKIILSFTCLLALTACGGPSETSLESSSTIETVNVTFNNYDGVKLYEAEINKGEDAVYVGEEPSKPSTEKFVYTFKGWDKPLTKILLDTVFTAQYEESLKQFTIKWVDEDGTILETDDKVTYGTIPTYDGELPSKIEDGLNYKFSGWDKEIEEATKDMIYTAQYKLDITKGKEFTFGMYPQSHETLKSTVVELNKLAATLPTKDNANDWISYKYYALKKNNVDYMWYKDVTYNDNMYRGVYFDAYRPMFTTSSSSESNSLQDNNGYLINTVHWFKFEPITWVCLDDEGLVMAKDILDSQVMFPSADKYKLENDDTLYNCNDYTMSYMRTWLNSNFLDSSFTKSQQGKIKVSVVNNGLDSTLDESNEFVTSNCLDKVFLLSTKEMLNAEYGFNNSESRMAKPTDYAACMGAFIKDTNNNTYYWTRTPDSKMSYRAYQVDPFGQLRTWNVYGQAHAGVRPSIHL